MNKLKINKNSGKIFTKNNQHYVKCAKCGVEELSCCAIDLWSIINNLLYCYKCCHFIK